MAFEPVFDASQAKVFKFENKGDKMEGYYMGSFDHTGDYGPTKKHVFQTERGAEVIFGQRHLMQQLPAIVPGTMVRITWTDELAPKAKGRAAMKLFKFEQDRKNTIEVKGVDFVPTDTVADDTYGFEEVTDAPMDEVAPVRASRPSVPASAPSPERQAAAQRLLSGRGKQTA